ncbi:MAG: fumarylacetoacetate hydrolase family protein, partial [Acidobacteria bacterium]|nr:fumarylacetoacetate hydrolase family protein [Acidobacteriota bacterium]
TATDSSGEVRYGWLEGDTIIESGPFWSGARGASHARAGVRLLPPCCPSKIVCVGKNYAEHAREMGGEPPAEPLIFLKPPSALIAGGDAIVYPRISQRVDHEAELGVVIGRRARHVRAEEADEYVLGYTCVNDVTARDLQKKDGQWTRGKGFDTFCAVGPWIVPREEMPLEGARVRALVDGVVKQDSPLSDMIFPVGVIIAFVTQFLTLEPGDLLATGTPPGIGPVEPGAVVRIEVTGVGAIENRVVGE